MLLTAISPLFLYALILRQELVLVFGISEWIEIIVGVIFLESIWVGVLVFFIGERNKEKRERKAKLSKHYDSIRENVLTKWLELPISRLYQIEVSCVKASAPLYIATCLSIRLEDTWHKWALQHIYDEKGYPGIKKLIEELETHEKNHNDFVSSLLITIDHEVQSALKIFQNLKETKEDLNNYYDRGGINYDIQSQKLLKIKEKLLYTSDGVTVAVSDNDTLIKLKNEIERIRDTHKNDFEKIKTNMEKDQELLNNIKRNVKTVIYELEKEKPLKGKCDYERSLDSTS